MSVWGTRGEYGRPHRTGRAMGTLALSVALLMSACDIAQGSSSSCANEALRTATSAHLPDCRAFEQVSPVDKGGFAAVPPTGAPAQTAPSGQTIAYLGYNAFPDALGNTALFAAHVSTRTADGWNTAEWTPQVPKAEVLRIYKVDYAFSEDLSQGILQVPLISLAPGAAPYASNLFRRGSDGRYSLVNTAPPLVSVQTLCEPEELASCYEYIDVTSYAGSSTDFSHVIFESSAQFKAEAPPYPTPSLYESSEGQVRLVGVLPDGKAAQGSTAGAGSSVFYSDGSLTRDQRIEHAISTDGSRVVFQATADGGSPNPAQNGQTEVYDRVEARETIELSTSEIGATPENNTPAPAKFWTASDDGSRVFFTTAAELTTQAKTGVENGEDLYEYDFNKPVGERLTDLSLDVNPVDAASGAMVQGVVGASNDGSYVYFVAKGQLVAGKGVDGQPNLYMVHDAGAPIFIATLSGAAACNLAGRTSSDACDWTANPAELEAYVVPNGKYLGFMSIMKLPTAANPEGYNNIDRATHEPDSEVYEYSAPTQAEQAANEFGKLVCASCDPTGAQPIGSALIGGVIQVGQGGEFPYNAVGTPFHRVRAINEAGTRLVYAAPGPMGHPFSQAYEYEQDGEGSCVEGRGCHYLLSNPGSADASQILGMGPDGNDIFLVAAAPLAATDVDNLRDVYDARVGGGFATSTKGAGCEGDCRHPASASSGPPPLVGYSSGASGNVAVAPGRPPTRAQKLAKALKQCRAKRNKRKRVGCEAIAKRRYGAVSRGKAKKSDRKVTR
jgi:hypothetical protein